jgi:RecJ-like exonuclease
MNATTHLEETCGRCAGRGIVDFCFLCQACHGTGRVTRSLHDPRSAIDYELDLPTPERWARIRELAAVCRDETNSEPVRMLLEEVGR